MRKECIEIVIEEFGEPTHVHPTTEAILDKYTNILPSIIIDIWRHEGFCQFQNGLYYIVNPDEWQDVVDVWMENTPFEQLGKFYALARNAFGCIYIYNPDTGTKLTIDTILRTISGSIKGYFTEKEREITISGLFAMISKKRVEFEIDDKPIFKKAVKKLGPLGWYEMYAFEPAFALIGDAALTMDNLVKVDARVHMLLLRDLIDQPKI